jgi:hypothetical protein
MAPERFQLRQDASTDVYSLGATLFELLAGEPLGPALLKPKAHNQFIEERIGTLPHRPDGLIELLIGSLIYSPEQRLDASGFYDLCQSLLAEEWLDEPSLKDWAERVVPLLLQRQGERRTDDPLVGVELYEEEDAEVEPPLTRACPHPRRFTAAPRRRARAVHDAPGLYGPAPRVERRRSCAFRAALRPSLAPLRRRGSPSRPVAKQLAETSGWFALRTAGIWGDRGPRPVLRGRARGGRGVGMLSDEQADNAAAERATAPALATIPGGGASPTQAEERAVANPLIDEAPESGASAAAKAPISRADPSSETNARTRRGLCAPHRGRVLRRLGRRGGSV